MTSVTMIWSYVLGTQEPRSTQSLGIAPFSSTRKIYKGSIVHLVTCTGEAWPRNRGISASFRCFRDWMRGSSLVWMRSRNWRFLPWVQECHFITSSFSKRSHKLSQCDSRPAYSKTFQRPLFHNWPKWPHTESKVLTIQKLCTLFYWSNEW